MSDKVAYASNPRLIDVAIVSAANTNRDGTGTIVTIASGSVAGLRVSSVVGKARVTTTAGMIRLFISVDNGATWKFFDEIPVEAIIVGANVLSFRALQTYQDLILFGTTVKIGASTHNAEAFEVFVLGSDL